MSEILVPHDYAQGVFINCPFDKDYEPILYAIVFAIRDLDLKPRFNVPFELGLDLGFKRYGTSGHKEKLLLILDTERDRYRMFISDIAGQDIAAHNGSVEGAISMVRDWLRPHLNPSTDKTPSGTTIYRRYTRFQVDLPAYCDSLRWDVDNLSFADFSWAVYDWINNNPI